MNQSNSIKDTISLATSFLLFLLPIVSLAQMRQYVINGQLEGLGNEMIYLVDERDVYSLNNKAVIIDSCLADNGMFQFRGTLGEPDLYSIRIPQVTKQYLLFVLDAGEIEIQGEINLLYRAKVAGSVQHDLYKVYSAISSKYAARQSALVDSVMKYRGVDTVQSERYFSEYNKIERQSDIERNTFVADNPNAFASMRRVREMVDGTTVPQDTLKKYYNLLSKDLRNSEYGKVLDRQIYAYMGLGSMPRFAYKDLFDSTRTIANDTYQDKLLIIDFWATWCIPCIEELPVLRSIKGKYRDTISILSISLDKDVEGCKEFILSNDMDWDHICDGLVSRSSLVVDCNVSAIPRVIACDGDGKILFDSVHNTEDLTSFVEKFFSAY